VIGFDVAVRDFTDCTASAEPSPDWFAVVHEGGAVRALDRHMPAFGEALTADDIEKVVDHLRTFCAERAAWPIGDLNFPRAFFTEKAFPENETVLTTSVSTKGDKAIGNELVYERRLGARNQLEVIVPDVADLVGGRDQGGCRHALAGVRLNDTPVPWRAYRRAVDGRTQ